MITNKNVETQTIKPGNEINTVILSAIAAMDNNRAIGYHGRLPWRLPADLKHFKQITMGKPVIMGRITYESIGKPLPGRKNIIISQSPGFHVEGCSIYSTFEQALQAVSDEAEVMVIGGASLYKAYLQQFDRLYITLIDHEFAADSYFPEIPDQNWQTISKQNYQPDADNHYPYSFQVLEKI